MADDQTNQGKKLGRITAIGASIIAAIGIIATLATNITTIVQFVEPIFSTHSPTSAPAGHPSTQRVRAQKVVKVCMGEGGGTNCSNGADSSFDCNAYSGMGGGGQKTTDTLAERFCGYTENGVNKVDPNKIAVIQNNGGGKCGWTAFQVTCNP
jgi:hypothetical protein